jgi:YbbR domain-containing protein
MTFFTANWEYKVISVFFAIALYFYFSDQIAIGKTLRISQLDSHSVTVPDGWVVTDVDPGHLEILVRGPKSLVMPLTEDVSPLIDIRDIDRPVITVNVTTRLLGIDPKIKIEHVGPQADIQVRVEKVDRKAVKLSDTIEVRLPEGLTYRLVLDNSDIELQGPKSLLDDLQTINVQPVVLSDLSANLTAPIERQIRLEPILDRSIHPVSDAPIRARVTVLPVPASKVVTVPVRVVTPPEFGRTYRVTLNQKEVTVTVRGPQALLETLNAKEQMRALVEIDPSDPGWPIDEPRSVPVRFDAPSWLSAGTSQVRVTLSLNQPGAGDPGAGGVVVPVPDAGRPAVPVDE